MILWIPNSFIHIFSSSRMVLKPIFSNFRKEFCSGNCSGNLKVDKSNRAGAQRRGDNMTEPAA